MSGVGGDYPPRKSERFSPHSMHEGVSMSKMTVMVDVNDGDVASWAVIHG